MFLFENELLCGCEALIDINPGKMTDIDIKTYLGCINDSRNRNYSSDNWGNTVGWQYSIPTNVFCRLLFCVLWQRWNGIYLTLCYYEPVKLIINNSIKRKIKDITR